MLDKLGGAFVSDMSFPIVFFLIVLLSFLLLDFTFLLGFYCRLPSLLLVHINQGNVCHWLLSWGTGWNMRWRTVRSFLSWCNAKLWLMGKLEQIRLTLLVSWVRTPLIECLSFQNLYTYVFLISVLPMFVVLLIHLYTHALTVPKTIVVESVFKLF